MIPLVSDSQDLTAPAYFDARRHQWYTYGQLADRVNAKVSDLRFSRKALVFCFCANRIESIVDYLACLTTGHAVLLLPAALNAGFAGKLLELYRPDLILALPDCFDASTCVHSAAYTALESENTVVFRACRPDDHNLHPDLALLLSTSGSTGSPKLVRLSMRNLTSNAQSIAQALDIGAGERSIGSLPFHYSYGLSVINSHLAAGAAVVLSESGVTSAEFWDTIRTTECTSFAGVPYTYQVLSRLKLDSLNAPSLKTMTQAGGKLPNELIGSFHQVMCRRQGRFLVMYGQTEATARICVLPHSALPWKIGSAGKPIPGGALIVDRDGQCAQPYDAGELVYSGPNVMMGYANSTEDLSAGDTQGGRLATGDHGYLDSDGFVFITGRLKRFSKLFGLRVNLDDVETMLKAYGPTMVMGGDDRLLIFTEYGGVEEFVSYGRELSVKLSLPARTFQFQRLERLPLTANGKPDYEALMSAV